MSKVIAIGNQKGGVAKTTTTGNLGIGLAMKGKRVLLIDADPQGSLTASLGYQDMDSLDITLATILGKIMQHEAVGPEEGILHQEEGVDLLPCNLDLAGLELSMVGVNCREMLLRKYIRLVADRYDYILIDCMPSLGITTVNAFTAADSILIPVQAAFLPVRGLEQLMETISNIREDLNPELSIEGILMTMVDQRTNFSKDIQKIVSDAYGDYVKIFKTVIPRSVRAEEMSASGTSIYKHDPDGRVAQAYMNLTEEVLHDDEERI